MNKTNGNIRDDDSEQKAYRVAFLIAGYIRRTLTDKEHDELDDWVTASQENTELFAELIDEKNIEKELKTRTVYDSQKAVQSLRKKLGQREKERPSAEIRHWAYGIAASVLIIAGIFFLTPVFRGRNQVPADGQKADLKPGGNRATLTLADGKLIVLDSVKGRIVSVNGLNVTNKDAELEYEGQADAIAWHTLATPKGGQYKVMLPDGTAVWLNAASSLRYPLAFTGAERNVVLTGEGYFEVKKDPSKKFIVETNGIATEVLGTYFNISSYADEGDSRITLLEGSIKVTAIPTSDSRIIKPGEQAIIGSNFEFQTSKNIDLDEVIAWKNGLFEFKDEPVESIMRQVARWYDVDIRYEGKVNYHFNASIERNVPVSKLFYLLELTDRVHFEIKDKTIIVKP